MGKLLSQKDVKRRLKQPKKVLWCKMLKASIFGFQNRCKIHLKLDNMQNKGKEI